MTREQYLIDATTEIRVWWKELGHEVPEIHVSVGFPSTRSTSAKNRRIGECWHGDYQDGQPHVFISPLLEGPRALDVLIHETIHAFLPSGVGHRAPFKRAMKLIGLEGKATATVAGEALRARLDGLMEQLGEYPHVPLKPGANGRKKQTTRLLKVECDPCGYIVRVTRKPLDEYGPPICPSCMETMEVV